MTVKDTLKELKVDHQQMVLLIRLKIIRRVVIRGEPGSYETVYCFRKKDVEKLKREMNEDRNCREAEQRRSKRPYHCDVAVERGSRRS